MSNKPKALMTQYAEGCLVARELQDMLVEYAADARFDREMVDAVEARVSLGANISKTGVQNDESYKDTIKTTD